MRRSQRDAEFEAYVVAARPRLRRLAYSLSGDWHTADDVVQTALAKLYVAWPRVRRAADPDAYVRRSIANAVIDTTRRPWRREVPGLPPGERAQLADPEPPHDLVGALQRLPEMQRRTVVLRHWWGLSVAETADDLGIAEGTVKSHTSRGLAALQALLEETHDDADA